MLVIAPRSVLNYTIHSEEIYRESLPEKELNLLEKYHSINRKKWLIIKMYKTNIEVRIPVSTIFDGKALILSRDIQ